MGWRFLGVLEVCFYFPGKEKEEETSLMPPSRSQVLRHLYTEKSSVEHCEAKPES